jgi:outer membrane protein assembly factor BamB
MRIALRPLWLALSLLCTCALSWATETENFGIRILPAPGKVVIDGKLNDWDLSGGILACSDAENLRDQYSQWCHVMYDAENLYVLARWKDPTPLNNPGVKGDLAFQGDCLQFRTITTDATGKEKTAHWTCWKCRDGRDIIQVELGRRFNEGNVPDAKEVGAQQAFTVDADGKGYVQELAVPWSLLTADKQPLKAGDRMVMTLEPNFTAGSQGRITIKDIFKPGVQIDRVFTFQGSGCWGYATLEKTGKVKPQSVRLSDGREFPVTMEAGLPVVNWTGLVKGKELPGFKPIRFTMPFDGYVSLNLFAPDGTVARQLLTCAFYTKGEHEIKWDGLTTPYWRTPGQPVAAGDYTWKAIAHQGIGLRLRGWADNGGSAPWDSSLTSNWGGDHGVPYSCTTDGDKVYLGWTGAEAGKALVACDLQGNVQWRHTHGGMGGAEVVAVDNGIVYVDKWGSMIYRLDAKTGIYSSWKGKDTADLPISVLFEATAKEKGVKAPERFLGMDARGGKVFVSVLLGTGCVVVLDGATGAIQKCIDVEKPGFIRAVSDELLYVVQDSRNVVAINPQTGAVKPVITDLAGANGVTTDAQGKLYVSVQGKVQQVLVFTADGKPAGAIGRKGGRPALGTWVQDGVRNPAGLVVDKDGKLWVAEASETPKRISVWQVRDGAFLKEFFGPTHYGASGAAINPRDPNVMVGEGCEWRIDPKTGREVCLGTFANDFAGAALFAEGGNGKLYLVMINGTLSRKPACLEIYERLSEAKYALRGTIEVKEKTTVFWADANGDGQQQPDELATYPGVLTMTGYLGWSINMNGDLTLYANGLQFKVADFTACGAPRYDVAGARKIGDFIGGALSTPDNRKVVVTEDRYLNCYDTANGRLFWKYPNTFAGVHGSHNAPPPEVGLIRGAFGVVGNAQLPKVGGIWAINSNVGEWHVLTEDGFYLTRLFQGDGFKIQWPDQAVPGAILDNAPSGSGGEDFGGSLRQGKDGKVYIQSGKVAIWNVEMTGLDTIQGIPGGQLIMSADDVKTAQAFRDKQMQVAEGNKKYTVKKAIVTFNGNLDTDFKGFDDAGKPAFEKQAGSRVRVAMAHDETNLYVGWEVQDDTPWVNGADAPEYMYARGDTVDLQLGTDPAADKKRTEPVKGDLRLSIGNFQGKPTAVVYRKVADEKHPKIFSSGVIKEYPMDSVVVLDAAQVTVKVDAAGKRYVVEAAIPLAALGLKLIDGLTLRGDFGATHSKAAGNDTMLRTYWNNQQTGIVDDEVFELKMEPGNWGEIIFP